MQENLQRSEAGSAPYSERELTAVMLVLGLGLEAIECLHQHVYCY